MPKYCIGSERRRQGHRSLLFSWAEAKFQGSFGAGTKVDLSPREGRAKPASKEHSFRGCKVGKVAYGRREWSMAAFLPADPHPPYLGTWVSRAIIGQHVEDLPRSKSTFLGEQNLMQRHRSVIKTFRQGIYLVQFPSCRFPPRQVCCQCQ